MVVEIVGSYINTSVTEACKLEWCGRMRSCLTITGYMRGMRTSLTR